MYTFYIHTESVIVKDFTTQFIRLTYLKESYVVNYMLHPDGHKSVSFGTIQCFHDISSRNFRHVHHTE